jgi:hypothetical protein
MLVKPCEPAPASGLYILHTDGYEEIVYQSKNQSLPKCDAENNTGIDFCWFLIWLDE